MKRRNFAIGITLLLLLITAIVVKGQGTMLSDGRVNTGQPLNAPEVNFIFGYSGNISGNALVINGVSVPIYNSGWYTQLGQNNYGGSNYICGVNETGNTYRNFFVVDLTDLASLGITPPIISAVLRINSCTPGPVSGTQLFELHSVSTPFASFGTGYSSGSAAGMNIFNDLGTGDLIGSVIVNKSVSNYIVEVNLNSAGLVNMNSSIGNYYILGGKADNTTPVPVPIWIIALGFVLIAGLVVIRFRRKRQLA